MSATDVGPARRAARRALRRLPPPAQLAVTRGLLRWRRRLRGVRTGAWARQPLLELPGGPPALLTALGGTADAEAVAAAADARRADGQGVLLVTDRDDFAAFRRRDLPFEYVPPVGDWERRAAPPAPYQA